MYRSTSSRPRSNLASPVTAPLHVPPPSRPRPVQTAHRTPLRKAPPSRFVRVLKRLLIAAGIGLIGLLIIAAVTFWYFDRDLPSVEKLRSYKPPQVTKVFCGTG